MTFDFPECSVSQIDLDWRTASGREPILGGYGFYHQCQSAGQFFFCDTFRHLVETISSSLFLDATIENIPIKKYFTTEYSNTETQQLLESYWSIMDADESDPFVFKKIVAAYLASGLPDAEIVWVGPVSDFFIPGMGLLADVSGEEGIPESADLEGFFRRFKNYHVG